MNLEEALRDPDVVKGALQVLVALVPALLVVALARVRRLRLENEMTLAMLRGLVQVIAMGAVLGLLLTVPPAWSLLVLALMVGAAARISRDRAADLPRVVRTSAVAIAFGSGVVLFATVVGGAVEPTVRNLVPVGSMVIAFAMRSNSLALDRLRSELREQAAEVEALLALGASPAQAAAQRVRASVRAAMIPAVDSMKSLGWPWIPGLMTGMILSGANPIYAAEYQFVIMAMVFAAGGLTALAATILMSRSLFTEAEQLAPAARSRGDPARE